MGDNHKGCAMNDYYLPAHTYASTFGLHNFHPYETQLVNGASAMDDYGNLISLGSFSARWWSLNT